MDHEEEERARLLDSSGGIVGRHSECADGSVLRHSGGIEAAAYAHSRQYRGTLAVMLLLLLCAGATVMLQRPGRHWLDDGAFTQGASLPSAFGMLCDRGVGHMGLAADWGYRKEMDVLT